MSAGMTVEDASTTMVNFSRSQRLPEQLAHKNRRGILEQSAHKGRKVSPARPDRLGLRDLKAKSELQARLDRQAHKDHRARSARRELLGRPARKDFKVTLEQQARLDRPDHKDLKVFKVSLDQPDPRERQARKDPSDQDWSRALIFGCPPGRQLPLVLPRSGHPRLVIGASVERISLLMWTFTRRISRRDGARN